MKADEIINITTQQLQNNFMLSDEEKSVVLNSPTEYFEKTVNCL